MAFWLVFLSYNALLAKAHLLPRADPPFQFVPDTATTPDNKFNIPGIPKFTTQPPLTSDSVSAVYGVRSVRSVPNAPNINLTTYEQIDIPFALLNYGNLKLFTPGQLNSPGAPTDIWAPGVDDHANQSACGIPDNAFWPSKVLIPNTSVTQF